MPVVSDLGTVDSDTPMALTFYPLPRDPDGLAALVAAVRTPGSPQFHKFLSVADYAAQVAPTTATLANMMATLQGLGFHRHPRDRQWARGRCDDNRCKRFRSLRP